MGKKCCQLTVADPSRSFSSLKVSGTPTWCAATRLSWFLTIVKMLQQAVAKKRWSTGCWLVLRWFKMFVSLGAEMLRVGWITVTSESCQTVTPSALRHCKVSLRRNNLSHLKGQHHRNILFFVVDQSYLYYWWVVWNIFFSHSVGNVVIPID